MSGSVGGLGQPLGAGVPLPGGAPVSSPGPNAVPPGAGPSGANALAPQAGNGSGMPSSPEAVKKVLQQHYGEAKTKFEETGKAMARLDHLKKALDRLADKGDMVTPEHVIAEAGKLVGHGIDPTALAGILADMPQQGGGEALGGWVQGHAITVAQGEVALKTLHEIAQHEMGVAAIHMITAHDVGMAMQPPSQGERMDGGNQLDAGSVEGAGSPVAPAGNGGSSSPMAMAGGGSLGQRGV